jgi:hypothetical protein
MLAYFEGGQGDIEIFVNISANSCINALSSGTLKKIFYKFAKLAEKPERKCPRSFENFKVTKYFASFVVSTPWVSNLTASSYGVSAPR